jgi:ABC-type multidrug transport system ATPase subunit
LFVSGLLSTPIHQFSPANQVLTMYARLRGVPPTALRPLVGSLLSRLGLAAMAGRLSGTLSGGNKRKLALGVALVRLRLPSQALCVFAAHGLG